MSASGMVGKYSPSTSSACRAAIWQTLLPVGSHAGTYPVHFASPTRFGPRVALMGNRQGE